MANKSFVVQYIIKAREQFSESAKRVARSSESMTRSVDRAKRSFKSFAKGTRTAGIAMGAALTAPMILAANSMKNAARDATEVRAKFAAVFKDISAESETMADTLAKNYGLAGSTAREMLSGTGDILTGFDFTQKKALDLSNKIAKLSIDLVSFTNYSGGAKNASEAMTKALLGEREAVVALGMKILDKDVKAKAREMAANGHIFRTERQAVAEATYAIMVTQSKNAIGDYARTKHELAAQERIAAERTKELKEAMGKELLPMYLKIAKAQIMVVDAITAMSPETKRAILWIGGILAVLGPLLLAIGAITLALPLLSAAFAGVAAVAAFAFGPIGLIIAAIALGAHWIITNWDKLKVYFVAFGKHLKANLIDPFVALWEKVKALFDMIANFSFSDISFDSIKASFMGESSVKSDIGSASKMDIGLNLGLAKGLEQTEAPVISYRQRRPDVGFSMAGG